MTPTPHVLVVGAGIGGLTAAAALQRAGARVSLFEQAAALGEIGAGVLLTPQAIHALRYLGVADLVEASAGPPMQQFIRDYATGSVLKSWATPDEQIRRYGAPISLSHRADLHHALSQAALAPGRCELHLNHLCEGVEQSAAQATVSFRNGKLYYGDVLIGCDGGASRIRGEVFGDAPSAFTGQVAYRALVPMTRVPESIQGMSYANFIGPRRMLLHYPLRHRSLMNVIGIAYEPHWQEEGWTLPASRGEFLDLYSDFHPSARALIECLQEGSIFKWGLRDRDPLEQWVHGRVAMLGDAAHPMSPFLGQGATMAIEDGIVLGRAFAQAPTIEVALATYEATRKARANAVQLNSRQRGRDLQGRDTEHNPGKSAEDLDLFAYNPAAVSLAPSAHH